MESRAINASREPLDVTTLAARIRGLTSDWRTLAVVSETGSTNADLIARSETGEDVGGCVLAAEYQYAGRGRRGRRWVAPRGSQIAVSFGVPIGDVPAARWGWLPLAAGLAVVDAVANFGGVQAGLKWPNDVLAGESHGKLAGVLAEVSGAGTVIVVGIGLNVTLTADERPDAAATSLLLLGADDLNRADLFTALLEAFARRVRQWRDPDGGPGSLRLDYLQHSLTRGTTVAASLPDGRRMVGLASDVDGFGRIVIHAEGDVHTLSAADIVHLRSHQATNE